MSGPIVLYIAGFGRSGSTILANLLGEAPGVFSAGELSHFWGVMSSRTAICGCGLPARECPVWADVAKSSNVDEDETRELNRAAMALVRLRRLPGLALGRDFSIRPEDLRILARRSESIYNALGRSGDRRVIVDSSKMASYAYLLSSATSLDLRIVQLVRDARGVAHSWRRVKPFPVANRNMDLLSLRTSTLSWMAWNAAAEALWRRPESVRSGRYLLVRYEDFVRRPRETARRILEMVGMGDSDLPFIDETTARLSVNHTISGNPNRIQHGVVSFDSDNAWIAQMPRREIWAVTALAAPLLLHYGYPLRPRAAP